MTITNCQRLWYEGRPQSCEGEDQVEVSIKLLTPPTPRDGEKATPNNIKNTNMSMLYISASWATISQGPNSWGHLNSNFSETALEHQPAKERGLWKMSSWLYLKFNYNIKIGIKIQVIYITGYNTFGAIKSELPPSTATAEVPLSKALNHKLL